jgi:hypothetical protein
VQIADVQDAGDLGEDPVQDPQLPSVRSPVAASRSAAMVSRPAGSP